MREGKQQPSEIPLRNQNSTARSIHRALVAAAIAVFLVARQACAFDSPLSEEAIREAYFLGQHHDESVSRFLSQYSHPLPVPASGPQVALVTALTPFAQAVVRSSSQPGNYSAQQAVLDHRRESETLQIQVAIRFTNSYGPLVAVSGASSSGRPVLVQRSSDFWRDFDVSVFDGEELLKPSASDGRPDYSCVEHGCFLIGATIQLEFHVRDFPSQQVTVEIDPPEGAKVMNRLDLSLLR